MNIDYWIAIGAGTAGFISLLWGIASAAREGSRLAREDVAQRLEAMGEPELAKFIREH